MNTSCTPQGHGWRWANEVLRTGQTPGTKTRGQDGVGESATRMHCYLDAGGAPRVGTENFADRSELGTEECFRVIDEIAAFAPECLTILTGGEPLLRRDILEIVRRAAVRGLWVVVGTNGVSITENVARRLAGAGAPGLSLSLDALDPDRHDRFRKVRGAWRNTVEGAEILNRTGLPFIVQTTA